QSDRIALAIGLQPLINGYGIAVLALEIVKLRDGRLQAEGLRVLARGILKPSIHACIVLGRRIMQSENADAHGRRRLGITRREGSLQNVESLGKAILLREETPQAQQARLAVRPLDIQAIELLRLASIDLGPLRPAGHAMENPSDGTRVGILLLAEGHKERY